MDAKVAEVLKQARTAPRFSSAPPPSHLTQSSNALNAAKSGLLVSTGGGGGPPCPPADDTLFALDGGRAKPAVACMYATGSLLLKLGRLRGWAAVVAVELVAAPMEEDSERGAGEDELLRGKKEVKPPPPPPMLLEPPGDRLPAAGAGGAMALAVMRGDVLKLPPAARLYASSAPMPMPVPPPPLLPPTPYEPPPPPSKPWLGTMGVGPVREVRPLSVA